MKYLLQGYSKLDHDYASFLALLLDYEQIPLFDEVNQDYSIDEIFQDYAAKRQKQNKLLSVSLVNSIHLHPLDHEFVDC